MGTENYYIRIIHFTGSLPNNLIIFIFNNKTTNKIHRKSSIHGKTPFYRSFDNLRADELIFTTISAALHNSIESYISEHA
jgi:hypothetical protein